MDVKLPISFMMSESLPTYRLLWIGPMPPAWREALEAAQYPFMTLQIEQAPDIQEALSRLVVQAWDGVVLVQSHLAILSESADSAATWVERVEQGAPQADLIVLTEPDALATVMEWINRRRWLRALPDQANPSALIDLVGRLAAWRWDQPGKASDACEITRSQRTTGAWQRLAQQATEDALTGLLRREEIHKRMRGECQRAQRTSQPLSCLMADIDFFKRVNDVFGHAMGDRTLRAVAQLLARNRRSYDLVGRVGGEEFLLVFPGVGMELCVEIAERLRQGIEQYDWSGAGMPPVTISMGVAALPPGDISLKMEDLLEAADRALYAAKEGGRNQVRVAKDEKPADTQPVEPSGQAARPRILVVDDERENLDALLKLLGERYQVVSTTDPRQALAWATGQAFDLAICDLRMPGLNGCDVLSRMKHLQPHCVRFLMTGHAETASAARAINDAGAHRFFGKPWKDEDLLLHVHQALEQRDVAVKLHQSDRETVEALALTIELNDRSTQDHYRRVAEWSKRMGEALEYTQKRLERLEYAAWLHDVGKVGIADEILKKTDWLTPHEEYMLREHVQLGAQLVESIDHLAPLAPIIRHHHERFDGSGYPDRLKGEAIPEESRIVAIANAFDGQLNPRRGGEAVSADEALAHLRRAAGSQFDPRLVELFLEVYRRNAVSLEA